MQYTPVDDAPRERQHRFDVRDATEVVREVGVDYLWMVIEQRRFHLGHRLLGIAAPPIGVLLGWKVGFEDRVEDQHRCCHAHPVTQSRDAQRPEFAVGFRDIHSSDRIRSVRLLPECKRQFTEPPLDPVRLDIRELLAVYTRRPLIGAALSIGMRQDVLAVSALDAADVLASAAQITFDAAFDAYRHGVGSITETTRAETALPEAQNTSSDAYSAALSSAATLALAAGTLGTAPE